MTNKFEAKSKLKVDTKSDDAKKDLKNTGDKIKTGARAVGNKIKDTKKVLGTENKKEKIKESSIHTRALKFFLKGKDR